MISQCINYLSNSYVSNQISYSFEHLLNSPDRISHINNHHSMDNQLNCKSILKRKSLELPTEDSSTPTIKSEDPQAQCSLKNVNLKSYRHGILKKHSASFDDDSTQKPILKNRCLSCDDETMLNFNELHSILKRKTSEQYSDSCEPHGILKKRELAVHQPDHHNHHHHHQPAAGDDDIRPILKQKKFDSDSADENSYPRPILKKKSSDASDDKRPILKSPRSNSPAKKGSGSKRLSVAQRVSDLESIMQDPSAYKKPVKENSRNNRDRSRFHTQPVTPSEIKAIKKTTAHAENDTPAVQNISTPNNHSTDKLATDIVTQITSNRDTPARASLKRTNSVSAKTREFQSFCDKVSNTSISDVNSNITAKSSSSKYKQCQEKKLSVANRYSTQPVTHHELQEAKNLNSAKSKNDDNNGKLPKRKLGSLIMDRMRIFNGITCTIDIDKVEKIHLKNEMADSIKTETEELPVKEINAIKVQSIKESKKSTEMKASSKNVSKIPTEIKVQPKDEIKKALEIKLQSKDDIKKALEMKFQSKDDAKKIPEIKVQRVKSFKEPSADNERNKSRISRNVAINRSFNSNSKLELLRQQKFGTKSKENEEFSSKTKKHVESSNDNTDGTSIANGGSIKDRLVALKKSGQTDWQKRISKIKPEDHEVANNSINMAQDLLRKQLTRQVKSADEPVECLDNILVDRLNRLETSSKDWKKRIEQKDTTNFTVAGKMQNKSLPPLTPVLQSVSQRTSLEKSSTSNIKKKIEGESSKLTNIRRSVSMSDSKTRSYLNNKSEKIPLENGSNNVTKEKTVNVPIMIDDDFDKFFGSLTETSSKDAQIDDADFDYLKSSRSDLLVQRKRVKVQFRRHEGSKNPLKAFAKNHDLAEQQYTENKSNLLLQRSLETSTINTPLAREALAALATKEDFAAVSLRKSADSTPTLLPPYKDLMLLHIKGRRRVQTRLVSPTAESVNQGDCYVLVTSSQIFVWIGEYSNVIERSHAAKVAQSIFDKKDLGCKSANQLHTINCDSSTPNSPLEKKFWTLLGVTSSETSSIKGQGAGHPDEDELYEAAIVSTNVVYEVVNDELVVLPEISETMAKIEILDPSKTLVFDFGSEIYVWYGKNVNITKRKPAIRLARQLFDDGYDYSQYDVSPIDVATCLGDRNKDTVYVKSGAKRPDWTLFAKITQHMETVLFREKFADWPDYSRVIKLSKKNDDKENGEQDNCIDWSTKINAFSAEEMLKMSVQEPDLVLSGSHLGRGSFYHDQDTMRDFVINTISVTVWHVQEFDSTELAPKSAGHFHSGDSYIIRWVYNVSIQGRELSGIPSRRMVKSGRNRCAYWYWHGRSATQNDQGAAALLTVQLDTEQGPQLRIDQGHEPPAFWNLFKGKAIVYREKRNQKPNNWRLFMVHGAKVDEAHLTEVLCSTIQLRSQTSFILLNSENGTIFVWHGNGSTDSIKELSVKIVDRLSELDSAELGLADGVVLQDPTTIDETKEPLEFFQALGCKNSRRLPVDQSSGIGGGDMKLFHFSSVLGQFKASLVNSAYVPSPYPYLQDHLYNVSQPATFMLDTGEELWLWQGWWPETATDPEATAAGEPVTADHRGSSSTRLQAERRAAMQTALDYWRRKYGDDDETDPKAYLVWAGLEPLRFTGCFPEWRDRDDIAEINMKHDHEPGETLAVEVELARVTQESYPAAQLLQRPLPDGVDPTRLELYLSPASFQGLLDMDKTEFLQLPKWKRTKIKQSVGLF